MLSKNFKRHLLASGSAVAMGVALLAGPANAFTEVNWTWTADINEEITKTVDINIDLDPTGMVMLEDLQIHIGDLTATSTVNGVYNWQTPEGEGTTTQTMAVDLGEFTASGGFPAGFGAFQINGEASGGDYELDPMLQTVTANGSSLLGNNFEATWDLGTIMVEFEVPDGGNVPLDALTELPEVVSTATAVANNTSIETDAAVQLHEGQFAVGGDSGENDLATLGSYLLAAELADSGVNTNLVGAAFFGTLALNGAIDPAQISANSTVSNIMNASVDSSATAVANNLTVNVEAEGDDRLLIGDAVQFSFANLSATSAVSGVNLYNYTNLGSIEVPIVSSVATAVGNNKSITVGAPVVAVPQP